jgi:hypothetical protein
MKIKEYLNNLENNPKIAKKYYLAVQNISKSFSQVEEEIEIPKYIAKKHSGPFLWIGTKSHYEFCHFDPDDGLLVMVILIFLHS